MFPLFILAGLIISGCQSQSFKVRENAGQAAAVSSPANAAPATGDQTQDATTAGKAGSGKGGTTDPLAEAGYNFASASAKAAESGESPSFLGSLFGGDNTVKLPPPPSQVDGTPGSNKLASGIQRVSLMKMTLRDAVGLAIAHHPEVSRGAAVVSQSAAEVSVAKGAWFPVLEYSVTPGYGNSYGSRGNSVGTQATVGVSQLVYDFGKTAGRIELADAGLNRQRHALNSTIESVAYAAATHYVEFAAAQATIEAAREAITNLRKTRAMISDRVKAGLSDASDLTQADVAMQRAIVDQVRAQTRLDVSAGNLMEIVGVRPKSVTDLMGINKMVVSLGGGDNRIEDSPAVMASKEAIKEAEARVKIAKSDYYPSIRVSANKNISSGGRNANDNAWVGVSLGGSISAVGQNIHRVDSAQAEKDAAARQLESQRLSTRTMLASAEVETAGAGTRRQALDTMKELSRTSRDLYWQEYTLNKRPLNQVLDSEREIFVAESERIAAVSDGIQARLKALVAVGLFVNKLREQ